MLFQSEILDANGAVSTELLDATNEQALHEDLHRTGRTLLRILSIDADVGSEKIAKKLPPAKLLAFIQALESSLDAGVPILAALESIEEQESNPAFRALFGRVRTAVGAGEPMSAAMRHHPRCFPPVLCALIQAGEESGGLSQVLLSLCSHLEWKADIAATVRQAIVYPLVVLSAGYGLFLFMMSWVLPSIGELLGKLGPDALPPAGRWLMATSSFFAANIVWILLATVVGVVSFLYAIRSHRGVLFITGTLGRLPIARRVVFTLNLTSLFSNLSVLQDAGLSLPHSLSLVAESLQLPRLRESIQRTIDSILSGARLHDSFAAEGILPPVALGMLRVGEDSGRLPTCMSRLARTYDREAKAAVSRAISLLEPVITAGLGLMVGGVAVLIISTLYSAMGAIGK